MADIFDVAFGKALEATGPSSSSTGDVDSSRLFDALINQESGGKQFDKNGKPLTSSAGAIGRAQVMPGTAPIAARLAGLEYDEIKYRTDPQYNEALGRAYFNQQLQDFDGDAAKALAAYNAGPQRLRSALATAEKNGNPDAWLQYLPRETQNYVPSVFARAGGKLPAVKSRDFVTPTGQEYVGQGKARESATIGDFAKELFASGIEGLGSAGQFVGEGLAAVANSVSGTEDYQGKNLLKPAAEAVRGTMTEGGQQARQGANVEGSVTDLLTGQAKLPDNVDSWMMLGANGFGSLLSSVIPLAGPAGRVASLTKAARAAELAGDTAKATELVQAAQAAARASKAIGAASGGAMTGGAAAGEVRETAAAAIGKMSHQELMQQVPAYAEAFNATGDEQQARQAVVNSAARWAGGLSSIAGAAGGAFNAKVIEDFLTNKGMSAMVGNSFASRAGRAAVGTAGGMVAEGGQEGTEKVGQNVGENIALGRDAFDNATRNTAGDVLGGMLVGGPVGMAGGAFSKPSVPAQAPSPLQPVIEQAQRPGSVLSRAVVSTGAAAQPAPAPAAEVEGTAAAPDAVDMGNTTGLTGPGPSSDPFFQKAAELESIIRSQDLTRSIRQDGAGLSGIMFDLRTMRDPNARDDVKEMARQRVEEEITWAQTNYAPKPAMDTVAGTPGFEPITGSQREPVAEEVSGLEVVQATLRDPNIGPKIGDFDRQEILRLTGDAQNKALPMQTRQAAAQQAIELVGRYRAGSNQQAAPQTPALLGKPAQTPEQIASPEAQQNVAATTESTASAEPSRVPAANRQRATMLRQLVDNGFETVLRENSDFYLVNSLTGQRFKLDGMADAQIARNQIKQAVDAKAHAAAASPLNDRNEPSKAQIEAGNYKKGDVIDLNGMKIVIENPEGSMRRGVSPDGVAWESKMVHHYGDFVGTLGADGDKMDVFIGPRPDTNKVFVIDQVNPDGSFDEHKVMVGFPSEEAARAGYLANYEEGWTGLGAITEMTAPDFKAWARSSASKKPAKPAAKEAQPSQTGQFATLEEAKAYLSAQRRANGNVSGLPLQMADGSFGIAAKGTPQYAEAQRQRDERDGANKKVEGKGQGTLFTVNDGNKQRKLKKVKKSDLPKTSSPARDGEPTQISEADAEALEKMAELFGKRVVVFSEADGLGTVADGFVIPGDSETIYIRDKTTIAPIAIFGHEFLHTLRETNPDAWDSIAKVVRTRVKDAKGFRTNYSGDEIANERGDADLSEDIGGELEELISDLGGNLLADRDFWTEVFQQIAKEHGKESKGIIARLAASIEAMLGKIIESLKAGGINKGTYLAGDYVSDIGAIRDAFKGALASYIKDNGISQASMGAAKAKAAQDIRKSTERSQTASQQDEYSAVEAKYKGTDAWMKAPSGEATKLTERQWVQVRTPSFKAWFGDWEQYAGKPSGVWNDVSGEVSKVVGDNGEPLVVYHGSDKGGFTAFDAPSGKGRGDLGIWTTSDYGMAKSYVRKGRARDVDLTAPTQSDLEDLGYEFIEEEDGVTVNDPQSYTIDGPADNDFKFRSIDDAVAAVADELPGEAGTQPGVYALFVNLRNPLEDSFEGAMWNGEAPDKVEVRDEDGESVYNKEDGRFFDRDEAEALLEENPGYEIIRDADLGRTTDDAVREARDTQHDGAIIRDVVDDGGGVGYWMDPEDVFVAFDPAQLKSADYNNGAFNALVDDLRKSTERKASKRPRQDPAIGDKTDVSQLPEGKAIPESAAVGGLESSLSLASSKSYRRGRDLKKDIQDRVLAAAKSAKVQLSDRTKSAFKFLANMVVADAKFALKSNENAVGWYDSKVSRAIGALSTVHPEINNDPRSRLAFLWALAVTSNGMKVGDNFRLAERGYRYWKANGKMPTDIGIGNAAQAINKGMQSYNDLVTKVGDERMLKFMSTKFTAGEIERMLGMKVGGEWKGTPVRGAAILGPKIGNGFFSNLNGYFDALTMDRWLMRTWGRMTGTLLEVTDADIVKSRRKLDARVKSLSPAERRQLSKLIGKPVKASMTRADLDVAAKASQKASMKVDKRNVMMSSPAMNEFRKAANLHYMTMDGQKEAPDGPAERNWIRAVFQESLESLQADGLDMTMSDLQALLWYPERRLYDAAKAEDDIEAGYEDDEAPDYANAAYDLAVTNGVDKTRVRAAMDAAEARGTVVGKQLDDSEKQAMMEEFRAPPEQQFQLAFEVAPNPDDAEATKAWNALNAKEKARITRLVKDAILTDLVDAVGMKIGKAVIAQGGYEGEINPNVIAEYKPAQVSIEQARTLAAAIGIALDQKSVALIDSRASETHGIVRLTLSVNADKHAKQIMDAITAGLPEVTGFTVRGKNIDILNFADTPTESLADKISDIVDTLEVDADIVTSFGEANSELVKENDYESHTTGVRPGSGSQIRERAQRARARAREIVGAELRGQSGQVPVSARGARRSVAAGDIRKSPERDRTGRTPGRGLAPLEGAPLIEGATGPDPRLVQVAEQYARDNGISLRRQAEYVQVDPKRAARIAAAYEAMPHAPQDPAVKEAFQNLINQTVAQYRALEKAGYQFYLFDETNDPYAGNPWNAMRDLRANQTMGVFATESGFGSSADFDPANNPLLADTGIKWPWGSPNGKPKRVLANDLFRAVHDAFGHGLEGSGFRAQGEENAWQAHVRLFTGSAVGAITSETRGQNSWLNYGPNGAANQTAKVEDTVFADQKTGLMPSWTWEEGRVSDMKKDDATSYNQRIAALKDLISCLKK